MLDLPSSGYLVNRAHLIRPPGHLLPIRCGEGNYIVGREPRAALLRALALGYFLLRLQRIKKSGLRFRKPLCVFLNLILRMRGRGRVSTLR